MAHIDKSLEALEMDSNNHDNEEKICFAVTPIGGEGTDIRHRSDQVLRHIIEPVVKELGYRPVRADRIWKPGIISDQIINHLLEDDLVVADLTYGNPNVFYELGIRHATRKPVVSIVEEGEHIPFDVDQSRAIPFNYRDLDSVATCRQALETQIRALEKDPKNFYTPVSMSIKLKANYESGDPDMQLDAQIFKAIQILQADVNQLVSDLSRRVSRLEGEDGALESYYHELIFPDQVSNALGGDRRDLRSESNTTE